MKMNFSARINELLAEHGLTQADLCRLTNLATSLVSNYCTGKTRPTLDNAIEIAKALGITLDELVGYKPRALTEQEKDLLDMFRELGDSERQEIFDYTEYKHAKKFLHAKSSNEAG